MPDDSDVRILVILPKSLFAEVIAHRAVKRLPSRMEAIRRLIRAGLKSAHDVQATHDAPGDFW